MKVEDMIESCEIATLTGLPVLQQVMDTRQPVDTVIVCSDGRLGVHRIVLAAASPFLSNLFEDQKLGEVAVVLLPDIKKSIMEILMHLVYTGQMFYPPEKQEEVYAAMDMLLFGQNAKLDLRLVRVKMPKLPERTTTTRTSPVPSTAGTSVTSSSAGCSTQPKTDKRKRKLGHTTDSKKRRFKKPKLDENGKQIQVAYRTGIAIGKTGVVRLRKKTEKKRIRDGLDICPTPSFESVNQSLSLPAKKWPLLSIRLKPIEDLICVEVHKKIKSRWAASAAVHLQSKTTDSTTSTTSTHNNNNTIVKVVEAIHHDNVDSKSDEEEPSNHNAETKSDNEDETTEVIPTSPTSTTSTTSPTPTSSSTSSTSSRREILGREEEDEEDKILCGMPSDKNVFYEKIAIN